MSLLDDMLRVAERFRHEPILVRIEQASPDMMQSARRHLCTVRDETLPPGDAFCGTPIVQNVALPLGTVRMVFSDGTWRDLAVPLFSDPFSHRARK